MISLKLSTLSFWDKKWALGQLNSEDRQIVKSKLKLLKGLSKAEAKSLFAQLNNQLSAKASLANYARDTKQFPESIQRLMAKIDAGEMSYSPKLAGAIKDTAAEILAKEGQANAS
ncbi:hypothetical protein [Colwellia sp. MEBiC06753]